MSIDTLLWTSLVALIVLAPVCIIVEWWRSR